MGSTLSGGEYRGKSLFMKKLLVSTISLSFLIVSLSLAYYFVVFLPQQGKIKQENAKAETEVRKECSNEIAKLNNSGKNTAEGWFKGVIAYKPKPNNGEGITFGSPLEVDQNQTYKNCLHYKGLE